MKKIFASLSIIFLALLFLTPSVVIGACKPCVPDASGKLTYCPLECDAFDGFDATAGAKDLGGFLSQAFQFGLAIAAALAVIMIVWGGVEIMLSEGPWGKMNGKEKIWNAIWGLGLALVSWLILYIINPDILIFKL
jgi:hypothetical protein